MHMLVLPDADKLFADLAPFDKVVLTGLAPERVIPVIQALREREISVYAVVVEGTSLQQILSTPGLVDRLDGPFRPNQVVLRITRFDRKGILIRFAGVLSRVDARVEGPLQNATDAEAFKILTSLGVRSRIDVRQEGLDWSSVEELLTDNFLAMTARASLDPFTMLYGIHEDPESRLSLGSVYFDDCRDYLQVDRNGRLYLTQAKLAAGKPLDATLADRNELADLAPCAEAAQLLRRHLQEATDCAFCGGFRACRAYFRPAYTGSACSQMFATFHEVIGLAKARVRGGDGQGQGARDPGLLAKGDGTRDPAPIPKGDQTSVPELLPKEAGAMEPAPIPKAEGATSPELLPKQP
jgi:hypothetical protein